jgi:hypothetical protein
MDFEVVISTNSHVTRNHNLPKVGHDKLSLLGLHLENPSSFVVAAAECGARNDVSGEVLQLRPNVQLQRSLRAEGLRPSADQLFAARRKRWQHALQIGKHNHGLQGSIMHPLDHAFF